MRLKIVNNWYDIVLLWALKMKVEKHGEGGFSAFFIHLTNNNST